MPPASPRASISMCWTASTANWAAISIARAFTHRAIYNRDRHRIEMHLISRKAQTVRVLGHSFSFRAGETIHTENSYKYSLERFTALARGSGWTPLESWTDAAGMFSVHALVASD